MLASLSLVLASAMMAVAQTTTLDIVFPVEGIEIMYGSVISASPDKTTYALHCGENVENAQCHILNTQTVVEGPSTLTIKYFFAGDEQAKYFSEDLACNLDKQKGAATCSVSLATVNDKGETITSSTVMTNTDLASLYKPVVITEGADKLIATSDVASAAVPASTTSSLAAPTAATGGKGDETSVPATGSGAGVASDTAAASSPSVIVSAAPATAGKNYLLAVLVAITAVALSL